MQDLYIMMHISKLQIQELEYLKKIQKEYLKDFTEQIKHELEKWAEQDFGLSIAKEVLDKNGGRIDIKSEVGKGTEVVITLPTILNTNTEERRK